MKSPACFFLTAALCRTWAMAAESGPAAPLERIQIDRVGVTAPVPATRPVEPNPEPPSDSAIVILPPVEVTATGPSEIKRQLAEIERERQLAEKASKSSWLDRILNPAFLGGASAKGRATAAKKQVEVLDLERMLLIAIDGAKSSSERARIETELSQLRELKRALRKSMP